jgi:photosystem II stability/assembly factor-like uncharacterized protein
MNKIYSVLIALILLPNLLFGEDIWMRVDNGLYGFDGLGKVVQTENGSILLSTFDGGIFISEDKGMTWTKCDLSDFSSASIMELYLASNGDIIACEMNGYVMKSKDNGKTWYETTKLENNGIKISEMNSKLYLATFSGEIYTSTDFGENWSLLCDFEHRLIFDMVVDVNQTIYILTNQEGVLQSSDNGISWSAINKGLPVLYGSTLQIIENTEIFIGLSNNKGLYKYDSGSEKWVAIYQSNVLNHTVSSLAFFDESIFAGTENGVWIFKEGSWSKYSSGLPEGVTISDLLIDDESFIYAVVTSGMLFRSIDPIKNDSKILSLRIDDPKKRFAVWEQSFEYEIVVKNLNRELIEGARVIINNPITNSIDTLTTDEFGEAHYMVTVPENVPNDIYNIEFNAEKESYQKSTSIFSEVEIIEDYIGDLKWTLLSNPANSQISCMYQARSGDIFLGTSSFGIYKSTDKGKTWQTKNTGLMPMNWVSSITEDNEGNIYCSTDWDGLVVSTNGGNSWITLFNDRIERARKVEIDDTDNIYLLSFYNDFFVSEDKGNSFDPVIDSSMHKSIGMVEVIGNTLFLFIKNEGLYQSDDCCKTLSLGEGLTGVEVRSVVKADGMLYAACGIDGLFISSDDGKSWLRKQTIPENLPFIDIYYNSYHLEFFANIQNKGIYKSSDGEKWRDFNDGMYPDDTEINDILFTKLGYAYASTRNSRFYRRHLGSITDINDLPLPYNDILVFPNPATSEINLEIPEFMSLSDLSISIYDLSLKTYISFESKTIQHQNLISLNIRNLTPGVYHLILSDKKVTYYSKFIKY